MVAHSGNHGGIVTAKLDRRDMNRQIMEGGIISDLLP
jgi:hypothetical protein